MECKYRFIDEYFNYKVKQAKKDCENGIFFYPREKADYIAKRDDAIAFYMRSVRDFRYGLITADECIRELAESR